MRLGIVTQPLAHNYGGILQNWALQQVLRDLGHEPVTIDAYLKYPYWRYLLGSARSVAYRMLGRRRNFPQRPYKGRCVSPLTGQFIAQHIATTKPVAAYHADLINRYALDGLVVGSDQVWRPHYNADIEDMYLRFAQGAHVRRVAYAASFGTDQWEYDDRQTAACAALAAQFDAISVRESSGIALCRQHLGVDATAVLDPTLLISRERYLDLCREVPVTSEPYLAVYCLDVTPQKREIFTNIAHDRGLQLRYFSAHNELSLTVQQWLAMFRDASMVLTDSFHGTVFSIIFQKDFYTFLNEERGKSRFESLLKPLQLESRIITDNSVDAAMSPIDFTAVEAQVAQLRDASIGYMRSSLEG